MARIRSIKPEFPCDEKLARISRGARYSLVMLITQVDDEGLILAAPRQLLGRLYPFDQDVTDAVLAGWIQELVDCEERVRWRYTRDHAPVLEIANWRKHQKIERPTPSKILPLLVPYTENPRELVANPSIKAREPVANVPPIEVEVEVEVEEDTTTTLPSVSQRPKRGRKGKADFSPADNDELRALVAAVWKPFGFLTPKRWRAWKPVITGLLTSLDEDQSTILASIGYYLKSRGVLATPDFALMAGQKPFVPSYFNPSEEKWASHWREFVGAAPAEPGPARDSFFGDLPRFRTHHATLASVGLHCSVLVVRSALCGIVTEYTDEAIHTAIVALAQTIPPGEQHDANELASALQDELYQSVAA